MAGLYLFISLASIAQAQTTYQYNADPWGGNKGQPCIAPAWPPASTVDSAVFAMSISAISRNGSNVTTVTVTSTATLVNGGSAIITGVADPTYNTSQNPLVITAAPTITILNGTQFTYPNTGTAGSSSGGTVVPANWYRQLQTAAANPKPWYLCSPLGNNMFFQGITAGQCVSSGTILTGKFSNNVVTAANACDKETSAWNFNGRGDQFTCTQCGLISSINFTDPPQYSTSNFTSQASDAVKDLRQIVSPVFSTATHEPNPVGCIDHFDPKFSTFANGWFATQENTTKTSKYRWGTAVSGADGSACAGSTEDFDTFPAGHNSSLVAWLLLQGSPIETYTKGTDRGSGGNSGPTSAAWLYADPVNYTKTAMASPPASCLITTPCSMATFLTKEYSTVGALNTAWGSTYSTLGSSGTCLGWAFSWCGATGSAVSVGTGDGTTLSFAFSTHANLDPFSVQILVNGVAVAGDCPQFRQAGAGSGSCGGSAGTGAILGLNITGGICTYSTGACTVTWSAGHAPAIGAAITANLIWGGWPKAGPGGGGTGLLDEDGSSSWIGTNGMCWLTVGAGTVGTTSYICRGGGLYPAPTANQTLATDLHVNWEQQYFSKAYSVLRAAIKTVTPNLMYGSPETTGTWTMPPPKAVLQACQVYCDWLYASDYAAGIPDNTTRAAMLSYYTTYYTGPMIAGMLRTSCPDSAVENKSGNTGASCQGSQIFSTTQPARALEYYNSVNEMLTKPSANNTLQWVGLTWWSLNDCDTDPGAPNNWGLKSCGGSTSGGVNAATTNNTYDGSEPALTPTTLACSVPSAAFTCGNEPSPGAGNAPPYGNLIGGTNGVKAANALWFAGIPAPPSTIPTIGIPWIASNKKSQENENPK